MERWRRGLILGPLGQVGDAPVGDLVFAVIGIGGEGIAADVGGVVIGGDIKVGVAVVIIASAQQSFFGQGRAGGALLNAIEHFGSLDVGIENRQAEEAVFVTLQIGVGDVVLAL